MSIEDRQAVKRADLEYEDYALTQVSDEGERWGIHHGAWSISIAKVDGVVPRVGSVARFYGRGMGSPVRGVDIDGHEVYYRTVEEEELEHRKWVTGMHADKKKQFREAEAPLNADYAALPEVFRRRIDHFRASNPDWRWEYESYEMSCCRDAVRIAAACNTPELGAALKVRGVRCVVKHGEPATTDWEDTPLNRHAAWIALNSDLNGYDYKTQLALMPGVSDGHSGNSFSMACRLAYWFMTEPENVYREHGALTPLVGCNDYGCRHPR